MQGNKKLAMLAAILGNGIFGFSFMFSRIALNVTSPFVMLMWRFLLAFAVLNIVALCFGRKEQSGGDIHWMRFKLSRKGMLPLISLGLIQPTAYFLCESHGISLTNSTFAGVIIAVIPIVALVAGIFTLKEIPGRMQVAFSVLSIIGVVIMTMQQPMEGSVRTMGVLLLLGAVLTGTAFNILSRKLSDKYSVLERTYVMMMVAAVAFTVLALMETKCSFTQLFEPLKDAGFLLSLLYLGVISSNVAFMALNYANNELPVARVTVFCNLTTIISLFAGVIFLGEPCSLLTVMASVMIIIGIWGVQRTAK